MYTTRMKKNIGLDKKGIDHESGERQRQKNALVDKKEKTIFFLHSDSWYHSFNLPLCILLLSERRSSSDPIKKKKSEPVDQNEPHLRERGKKVPTPPLWAKGEPWVSP